MNTNRKKLIILSVVSFVILLTFVFWHGRARSFYRESRQNRPDAIAEYDVFWGISAAITDHLEHRSNNMGDIAMLYHRALSGYSLLNSIMEDIQDYSMSLELFRLAWTDRAAESILQSSNIENLGHCLENLVIYSKEMLAETESIRTINTEQLLQIRKNIDELEKSFIERFRGHDLNSISKKLQILQFFEEQETTVNKILEASIVLCQSY